MRCTLCRKSVKESWDPRKTLRQNLSSLGLAFDANATVPLRTTKEEDEQVGYQVVGQSLHTFNYEDKITKYLNQPAIGKRTHNDVCKYVSLIPRLEGKVFAHMLNHCGIPRPPYTGEANLMHVGAAVSSNRPICCLATTHLKWDMKLVNWLSFASTVSEFQNLLVVSRHTRCCSQVPPSFPSLQYRKAGEGLVSFLT